MTTIRVIAKDGLTYTYFDVAAKFEKDENASSGYRLALYSQVLEKCMCDWFEYREVHELDQDYNYLTTLVQETS